MKYELAVMLSLAAVACSDDEVGDASMQTPYTLCDGSDGVRLSLVTTGGGEAPDSYTFTSPRGSRFLYVDGHCNFVSSTDVAGQLSTGSFSPEQEKTISETLNLAATRGLIYRFEGICPDAPATIVTTPDAYLQSGCGDNTPPAQVAMAFQWEPVLTLAKSVALPSTGPITVVARPRISVGGASSWPFAFPIEQAGSSGTPQPLASLGKTLTGDEAALARQVWASARAGSGWAGSLIVTSGDKTYDVYFRDELETSFASKLSAFVASASFDQDRAITRCAADRVLTREPRTEGVYGNVAIAAIDAAAPCGVELCWDGSFNEKNPVSTSVALQRTTEPRSCLGARPLTVSANLQPLVDAFRSSYPSAAVEIDLGFGTLQDSLGDDAICRKLSVSSCAVDAHCRVLSARINDATRQCSGSVESLGCSAKTLGCTDALTGAQAPDGRRAVFSSGCIPEGWSEFYGSSPDYAWQACTP